MSKKDSNNLDLKTLAGPFSIMVEGSKLFMGEIEGTWDNAILVKDIRYGSTIIPYNRIVVMIEGIVTGPQKTAEERKPESAEHQEMRQE